LSAYIQIANIGGCIGESLPCAYIGMVDKNPGCMIHPSRYKGQDVRADSRLTLCGCSPNQGCFFHNYLKTPGEIKLAGEFINGANDWYSYSRSLMESAMFNQKWQYLISRIEPDKTSRQKVRGLIEGIHSELRKKFIRKKQDVFTAAFEDAFCSSPIENYMNSSPLFEKWGVDGAFESRFRPEDFREWGYFSDRPEGLYIYRPLGEILPLHFRDVAITSARKVRGALEIVDETLEKVRAGRLVTLK
jgi:hypothetical protein